MSVKKTFGEIGSGEPVLYRPSMKLRKRAILKSFIKRLNANPIAYSLYRPRPLDYYPPHPPGHDYILNDVGANSNDSISKYFLAKMHNITTDQPDYRDWIKPYVSPSTEKLM